MAIPTPTFAATAWSPPISKRGLDIRPLIRDQLHLLKGEVEAALVRIEAALG